MKDSLKNAISLDQKTTSIESVSEKNWGERFPLAEIRFFFKILASL